jgi:biopolymer transport protein ExbD
MSTLPSLPEPSDQESTPHRRKRVTLRVAALNITSMMDLVLNLLLFFVLTASFAAGEGTLPARLPKIPGPDDEVGLGENQPTKLVVSLIATGRGPAMIQLEGVPATIRDAAELFEKLDGFRHNGVYAAADPIVIRVDPLVRWNDVVDAFNALVRAKYTDIGIASTSIDSL